MTAAKVSKLMKDNGVKFVDLRFTDTRGKEQHVTIPSGELNAAFYKDGKKSSFKERRKNKQDRRKSVREGVIVSLSFKDDRRVLPDRRKKNLHTNYTI